MVYGDGHLGWLVTSYSLARAVLADSRFSSRADLARIPVELPAEAEQARKDIPPGVFHRMDPPEHTRYRRLLAGHFAVRRTDSLTETIQRIVDERLHAMDRGGQPADLVRDFAKLVPLNVVSEVLGVPEDERDRFVRRVSVLFDQHAEAADVGAATQAIHTQFQEFVDAKKRAGTSGDVLGHLAASGELPDEEIATVGMVLLTAGYESTANMLALGTLALLEHPDQRARALSNSAQLDKAVDELLRYLSVTHIGPIRTALRDVELGGETIKAGDSVSIALPAANRDPEHVECPAALDIDNSSAGHLAFGYGVHQCLGQHLARNILRTSYAGIFREFPALRLAVPADELEICTEMPVYGVSRLPVEW
ncbi:cytochrome P450 [Saccharopolyspora elongata]|uniref:Cytochrome P450 n=2 Tax=Saccharopolyspora elongata TaxID=2530387 RepID=A0A4R4Y9T1_9PSEU|nr:cytochrome P450 [Saccharopolyspora elongata]